MNANKLALVLAVSAALLVVASAQAQTTLIGVTNATAYGIQWSGDVGAYVPYTDDVTGILAATPGSPGYAYGSKWETKFNSREAHIVFALEAENVKKIEIWNQLDVVGGMGYNNRGTWSIEIRFSMTNDFSGVFTEGVNLITVGYIPGAVTHAWADYDPIVLSSALTEYGPDLTLNFETCIPAKFVQITFGPPMKGEFYNEHGLCQVNFYACDVPEPATMSLLALGGLALLRRKRR